MADIDLELIRQFFVSAIPFHAHLGLKLEHIERGKAVTSIEMRPEFIGDPLKKILHGGVIATLLDVTGGITSFSTLDWPRETSLNTIDMRVDYVRMGKGERFTCEGHIIRRGNRIVVCRSDLKDDRGQIVALGTATYNIFSNPEELPKTVREAAEHILGQPPTE
jgi:uncharacterized protein (TIGR00369 family)